MSQATLYFWKPSTNSSFFEILLSLFSKKFTTLQFSKWKGSCFALSAWESHFSCNNPQASPRPLFLWFLPCYIVPLWWVLSFPFIASPYCWKYTTSICKEWQNFKQALHRKFDSCIVIYLFKTISLNAC